jgi:hypothetical protein
LTVPLPLPGVPPVTVIHDVALLVAVHEQPACVATLIVPVVAPGATDAPVGEIVKLHGTPAWLTVNVWPATVTVPERGAVLVFAATL